MVSQSEQSFSCLGINKNEVKVCCTNQFTKYDLLDVITLEYKTLAKNRIDIVSGNYKIGI